MRGPDESAGAEQAQTPSPPDRRILLGAALAAAALALAGRTHAAPALAPALARGPLPGGLTLITGAGGNVVVARGPGGAVMVDCGHADQADALVALALRTTGARQVATLFNTCWRLEQTGGNDLLAARGARILAHENTRLWMGEEIASRWEDKVYPARAPAARPTQTIYTTATLPLGAETVDYGYLLQAHTDGDIYVFFRKANVLVVGGAVAGRGWPVIDWSTGGWIGGHVRGLETLLQLADAKTVIVPADGPVLTRADLEAQHAMFVAIMTRLQQLLEGGAGVADVLKAAPAADYVADKGDPTLFLTLAFKSFWGHVRQFKAI